VPEGSARRTRNPAITDRYLDLFHGSPEFKSWATLVNSQLVRLQPGGNVNDVMFNLIVCSTPLAFVL